jgi:hypothetical protein
MKSWIPPFLLALGGITLDYITTTLGLSMGLCETNPHYHPVRALLVFWTAISILALTLPNGKAKNIGTYVMALASYLGPVNNALVILGIFSGLRI